MSVTLPVALAAGAAIATPLVWRAARRSKERSRNRAREAEARAAETERLAYVGQLAGGLAHEIKNPLSSLSLNLQLLMEDWREADPDLSRRATRRIQALQRETERLTGVLDDFLRFARGYDLALAECDLREALEETLDFFAPEAEQHRVTLRRDFGPAPPVMADERLLKQALFNLLVNARQAMESGGEIMVQMQAEAEEVCVHVTDMGPGIPEEEREAIFRPYFSTKVGGTGLGLPTAKRIVEEHGGALRLESEVDKGSRFTIALPLNGQTKEARKDG